jgi:hypothetical protein
MNVVIFPKVCTHQKDDLGFPTCECEACREKRAAMDARFVANMDKLGLGWMLHSNLKRGHDEQAECEDREQDYGKGTFNG